MTPRKVITHEVCIGGIWMEAERRQYRKLSGGLPFWTYFVHDLGTFGKALPEKDANRLDAAGLVRQVERREIPAQYDFEVVGGVVVHK